MQILKALFFCFLIGILHFNTVHGQQAIKTYEKEWKKVTALMEKNLPKSALEEVRKIYSIAKKENQQAQVIKALVTMTSLQQETREDNQVLAIKEMEKEIETSKEPASSILYSLLADMYWNYFRNHRWNLYDRTKTAAEFKKDDIATWDADDFHNKISTLYLQSIRNEKLLQQTRLEPFDALIAKGNVRHLRPTLFDLLAHRAIDYFENDERDISRPAYSFQVNEASAFDPAADFVTRKFISRDSLSLQYKALLTYQKVIAFHLKDAKPDALIDADLQRILFVYRKSVHPDKDNLYLKALTNVYGRYPNLPAASQAGYLVAAYYEQKASLYQPYGDTTHRYARLKAKEILQKIIVQKDSSEGKINANNLLKAISKKFLQFEVEKVNLPDQPFRALVHYRNFQTIYFRIIKADDKIKTQMENQYDEKYWAAILSAGAIRNWKQDLPNTNDMQQHKVEVRIDALPQGDYILVASPQQDFGSMNAVVGARLFYVSNISFVNNSEEYFVLHRETGQPLSKASVQVWEQKYDYKLSRYIKEKQKSYQADANGFFRMDKVKPVNKNEYRNIPFLLEVTHGKDKLFMNDWIYDNYYYRDPSFTDPKAVTSIFLFGDRSLYRPGQAVYFKGIVLNRNPAAKENNTVQGYTTTIYLRDANYQDIDSLKVTTNEFGSFNGKFQLPTSGLNGQFSIYTKKDNASFDFRMEEYKRPKFYVEYEPIKGTYKVNEKIKLTGIAKAYAGNNIGNALVKYRVVRQPRFPYPWLFRRWWYPPTEPMEIAHGEAKTGTDGRFIVEFTAIPDLTLDKKFEPVFDYIVYADITDINGETRSAEKTISVGYKSLMLRTNIPSSISVDSLTKIFVRTENMNGEFEPATVKLVMSRLKEEQRLIRNRFWERPDQFVMSKEEYIKHFPFDEYDNETDPESWQKGNIVLDRTDSSRTNGDWELTGGKREPGFYILEISTKDKDGNEVKDIKYIELFDEKSNNLTRPQYLWSQGAKPIEPGQSTTARIGTSADNLFLIHQISKGLQPAKPAYSFLRLNKEKKAFQFLATEADRGGFGAGWLFVKHNRVHQFNQVITVPWTNKELTVEYASFRDKTLPGSEERWSIKITGYKKEILAAEMLASMYDASLDQFYPHGWSKPEVWPVFGHLLTWNSSHNFLKMESNVKYSHEREEKYVIKIYDGLFTNTVGDGSGYYRDGRRVVIRGNVSVTADMSVQEASAEGISPSHAAAGNKIAYKDKSDTNQSAPPSSPGIPIPRPGQDPAVQVRKNFNETAFFFPELRTDSSGALVFSFIMPEALTKWKFMLLAHTKNGSFGSSTREIVTQKELMVQPNAPRFLREGDKMELSSKIVNLSGRELTGQVELQLIDATTNQSVDGWFRSVIPNQYFTVKAGESEVVKFPIEVPYLFNKALLWRIVAKANAASGSYSDGEENALAVLSNRMLVTESLPLNVRGQGNKSFRFDKLINTNSESLQHHALTIEYTSNPAWYAVQALPYLMEYPYDCAEQVWNRYYANSLATMIANSAPKVKAIFTQWLETGKDPESALLSNLQKNQELKSVLLEETPWVLQAKSEAEQKKNIALLFDMVRMSAELNNSIEKLKQMQASNGGFVWFNGGPDDRYMTQYIVTGIGHLKKLKAIRDDGQDSKLKLILNTAIPYLDRKIREDYEELKKNKTDLKKYTPWYSVIQYLYMRSFFPEYKIPAASQPAYTYFRERMQATWTQQNKYMQGMTALALHRTSDTKTPGQILKSLKETSINNEELGMYWKDAGRSWWWYEAPIERQALLIEAFQEIAKDITTVDDLKTWLLKNKQTNNWNSTKATAEACYALLLQGSEWLAYDPAITIKLGNTSFSSTENQKQAGTGYFKKVVEGKTVKPDMGNITVSVGPSSTPAPASGPTSWGAVYWQYFEDLDKITTAATPLKLVKKLFVEKNTDRGPVLTPINDGDVIKVGDKIKVRMELRVDRDMEYVHMKDMRASALEPVNVLSGYKWQGGLGYYESTKDASTNFFFGFLRKGTYVFEYPLFATHSGSFSNGITTIQCMYAPEFSSHSEGIRIRVE